jgi:hypothetical protein
MPFKLESTLTRFFGHGSSKFSGLKLNRTRDTASIKIVGNCFTSWHAKRRSNRNDLTFDCACSYETYGC